MRSVSAARVAVLVVVALATGCMATIPVGDGRRGGTEWTQRAELEVGARAIFDGGAIEVTLLEASSASALVLLEQGAATRQARISIDPDGFATFPPYEIHLVSATTDDRAVVEVARPWERGPRS